MTQPVKRELLACLALVACVLAVYARTLGHGFVAYDDMTYVVQNPAVGGGLSGDGLAWAFGLHGYAANWHPLTWLSHMLDVQLFGLAAAGHHATNVLLHALAACLCHGALRASGIGFGPSLFTAALFAVHPLRVESVAWVSERKDVLSGVFFFGALWAHAARARRPGAGRGALVIACTALGLLAKPMLVTLPFVLLVWDVWPLRRGLPLRRAAAEKAPLLALALVAGLLTWSAQSTGGAVRTLQAIGLGDRVENALVSYVAYLGRAVVPLDLACIRPHPALVDPGGVALRHARAGAALLLLVLLTAGALRQRRRRPWLLAGWLLFLGMLVPVIGLVQVGSAAWADRYAYLPLVGLQLAVALGAAELLERRAALARALGACVVLALGVLAFAQAGVWRDSETLFRHALSVTERNYVAHLNLANLLAERKGPGDLEEAIDELEAVLAVRPTSVEALSNLGAVLLFVGRPEEARPRLEEALRLVPTYVEAHFNLGLALRDLGDREGARRHLQRALQLRPGLTRARTELEALGGESGS